MLLRYPEPKRGSRMLTLARTKTNSSPCCPYSPLRSVACSPNPTRAPAAGATGLLAASADPIPDWQGFKFLLTALAGSSVMVRS